jgi:hypothetical protein
VPLTTQPVVVAERSGDQRERHLELGTSWFQNPDDWAALPADDGPEAWQRIDVEVDLIRQQGEPGGPGRRVDVVVPSSPIVPVELDAVTVSNVVLDQDAVSFSVDRTGVPVLVRVSYFPNWKVEGADDVYRVAPNSMVVVPTANDVRLSYGRTSLDWLTMLATLIGIGLCVVLRRRGDALFATEFPGGPQADADAIRSGEGTANTDVEPADWPEDVSDTVATSGG